MKTDKTVIGDVTIWWRFGQPIAFKTPSTGTIAKEGTLDNFPHVPRFVPTEEFNRLYDEAIANKLKETT